MIGPTGAIANTSSEAAEYRESIARLKEKERALRAQLEDCLLYTSRCV